MASASLSGPRPAEAAILVLPVWPLVRGALTVAATVGFLRLVDRVVPAEPTVVNAHRCTECGTLIEGEQ